MNILGRNNELDFDVCKYVFGIDPEEYKWGVPFFSSDRNSAAIVNTEMVFRKDGTKEIYEKEMERIVKNSVRANNNELEGLSIFLMILLPDEICKAAVMACRKNNP
jgi:hypothetical protein